MKFVQAEDDPRLTARSLGVVLSVRGAEARVAIPVALTGAETRATVGDFVRIYAGQRRLIGMITEVEAQDGAGVTLPESAVARIDIMGEIVRNASGRDGFRRGVSAYPAIGDAAGVVAPSSGEGIYYAMLGGRLAADAADECLRTGDAKALATARKRFMKLHGRVFFILGVMQYFWYSSDKRRERFVTMCRDPDVQRLTWESYMNKELPKRDPLAQVRVFFKDLAHLLHLTAPT